MKGLFPVSLLAALVSAAVLAAVSPSLAEPPKVLRIEKEWTSETDRLYPPAPYWQAFDPEVDARDNPQHFGFERIDDFRKPVRGPVLREADGCYVSDILMIEDAPAYYDGSIDDHLRGAGGVAFVRVLSVTPGVQGTDFASALEVELVEEVSRKVPAGPFPRYILYPGVRFEVDGDAFCVREKGFPSVPEPGDELAISLRVRDKDFAGLVMFNSLTINLDAEGPKSTRGPWEKLAPELRAAPGGKLKAWVRSAAKGNAQ